MLAAEISQPRTVTIVEADPPEPGPTQVQVRLGGSGVCGSNLPVWEGRPWFAYPLPPGAPGHEGWGRVERVGDDVDGLTPGTPVCVLSQRAFAEMDVAEAAHVVPLPPSLADRPFPGEALACAVNVMRRAGAVSGQRVAVVGVGFLGAVLVKLASLGGAEVTALSRRRAALDVAAALGARNLVELGDPQAAITQARDVNGQREFDVVFEVTGLQVPLDVAGELTAVRGKLVIAGYHQDGRRQIDLQLWNWRGLDVINAHERCEDVYVSGMREAVTLVQNGSLPLDVLVTHAFPLTDASAAFTHAIDRPDAFLKAVITNDR